jgi:hypothetical protein
VSGGCAPDQKLEHGLVAKVVSTFADHALVKTIVICDRLSSGKFKQRDRTILQFDEPLTAELGLDRSGDLSREPMPQFPSWSRVCAADHSATDLSGLFLWLINARGHLCRGILTGETIVPGHLPPRGRCNWRWEPSPGLPMARRARYGWPSATVAATGTGRPAPGRSSCFRGFFACRTSPAPRDRQSLADAQRNSVALDEELPFAAFNAFCKAHCGHPAHSPGKSENYGEGYTPEKKSRWHVYGMRLAGTVNSLITKTK